MQGMPWERAADPWVCWCSSNRSQHPARGILEEPAGRKAGGKERNDALGRTRQNAAGKEGKLALSEQGTAPGAPANSWEQGIKGGK